jgi:predicted TIM-barrel fold metal-dependent hydrolase
MQMDESNIASAIRSGNRVGGLDVIDVHAHIGDNPADAIWPQDAASLVADMDRCGVATAVFSDLGAIHALTAPEYTACLERSSAAVRQHPGRLFAYLPFHPHQLEASLAALKTVAEPASPFIGIKLHGAFHQYPAGGPKYVPAFEFGNRHRLPVLFHVAGIEDDWTGGVAGVLRRYPDLSLILAHFGPGEDRLPALTKSYPNVWTDSCLSTGGYRQIERVVASIGADRLLFASDATWNSLPAAFARIGLADLPDSQKRMLYGENARKLFTRATSLPNRK